MAVFYPEFVLFCGAKLLLGMLLGASTPLWFWTVIFFAF